MRWCHLRRKVAELGSDYWDVIHVHTPFLAHNAGVKLAAEIDEYRKKYSGPLRLSGTSTLDQ